jgi:hypothetical protein
LRIGGEGAFFDVFIEPAGLGDSVASTGFVVAALVLPGPQRRRQQPNRTMRRYSESLAIQRLPKAVVTNITTNGDGEMASRPYRLALQGGEAVVHSFKITR